VQNIGDGITSPSLQRGYADAVAARGGASRVRSLWLAGAGHCSFDTAAIIDALGLIERRIGDGRWPAAPARFVTYAPPPMLRPCIRDGDFCHRD